MTLSPVPSITIAPGSPLATVPADSLTSVEPNGTLRLSDIDLVAKSPVAEWHDDHWTVTWPTASDTYAEPYPAIRAQPSMAVEPQLNVVDVAPDLTTTTRRLAYDVSGTLVQGSTGRVAYTDISASDPRSCNFTLFDTTQPEVLETFTFWCADRGSVAPITGTEDWLISRYDTTDILSNVVMGRHRIGQDWVRGPWMLLGGVQRNIHTLAALHGDAWVAWGDSRLPATTCAQIPGIAAQTPADPSTTPIPHAFKTVTQYSVLSEVPGAVLAFYTDGSALHAVRMDDTSTVDRLLVPARGAGGSSGRTSVGAARIQERGLTAVCYPGRFSSATGDVERPAVIMVDDQGQLVGEPILLGESGYMVSCALAWSGRALLATWLDFNALPQTSQYSVVRASVVQLP